MYLIPTLPSINIYYNIIRINVSIRLNVETMIILGTLSLIHIDLLQGTMYIPLRDSQDVDLLIRGL